MSMIPPGRRHTWHFTHDLMFKRVISHPRALLALIRAALPDVYERGIAQIIVKSNDPDEVTRELIAEAEAENIALEVIPQKTMSTGVTGRQAVLDVFVRLVDGTLIDFEMQNLAQGFDTKRVRFYSSVVDAMAFERGMDVKEAPDTFVVFFCLFDPFGCAQPMYELNTTIQIGSESRCVGSAGDGRYAVVFNAKNGVVDADCADVAPSREMMDILRYMATGEISGLTPGPGILDELVAFENCSGRWLEGMFPIGEKLKEYEQQHEADMALIRQKDRILAQERQLREQKDRLLAEKDQENLRQALRIQQLESRLRKLGHNPL